MSEPRKQPPSGTPLRHRPATLIAGLAAVAVLVVSAAGCAVSPSAPSKAGAAGLDATAAFCADEINKYRAQAGVPLLSRSGDLDAFATAAAENDGRIGVPHDYFRKTNGGGIATGETQLLLWKGYEVHEVIREGLARMWEEGPTGSHYQILLGRFGQVGCGVFVDGTVVNVSQDFR